MKDRVPVYPGRVKLVPVSGQENVYDMTRADQPTQQGDPLNKGTLLKDATAALFGLGTDAVPDDVFQEIKKFDVFKVGDTLTTMRTDLGDKWLLCNGEQVSREEYPELSSAVSPSPVGTWTNGGQSYHYPISNSNPEYTSEIVYDGSYFYLATVMINYKIGLFRSSDLETWTLLSSFDPNDGTYVDDIKLIYQDGKFLIAWNGVDRVSPTPGIPIRSSSDPSTDLSSWSSMMISTGFTVENLSDFKYLNGYFVTLCSDSDGNLYLFHSQNLTDWAKVNVGSTSYIPLAVDYINGQYICFAFKYVSGSMGKLHYWVTSNISSFGSRHILGDAAENIVVTTKSFDDTLFIITTNLTPSGQSRAEDYIYSVTDLSTFPSGANSVILSDELILDSAPKIIIEKLYDNYLIFSNDGNKGRFLLAYFFDVNSISYVVLDPAANRNNFQATGIAEINGYYKVSYVSTEGFGFNKLDISKITLPSISADDMTHTYIKVKE